MASTVYVVVWSNFEIFKCAARQYKLETIIALQAIKTEQQQLKLVSMEYVVVVETETQISKF